jgi:hypothetical protein
MSSPYIFKYLRDYWKKKKLSIVLSGFCLLPILGFCLLPVLALGVICYDDDLLDINYPPVIAFQSPIVICHASNEAILIRLITESINLPLINKNPFVTRAPPV